jgi:phosphoribosylaminoimidazole carboxylase PurE protein
MEQLVIISGSESDRKFIDPGLELCKELNISVDYQILSAHRNVKELDRYLAEVEQNGKTRAIIGAAGLSAALPGAVSARVKMPVIGVPLPGGAMDGADAAASILQMPAGVPVATMGPVGKEGILRGVRFAKRIIDMPDPKSGEVVIISNSKSPKLKSDVVDQGIKLCQDYNIKSDYEFLPMREDLLAYLKNIENDNNKIIITVIEDTGWSVAERVNVPVLAVDVKPDWKTILDARPLIGMSDGVILPVVGAIGSAGMKNAVHFAARIKGCQIQKK